MEITMQELISFKVGALVQQLHPYQEVVKMKKVMVFGEGKLTIITKVKLENHLLLLVDSVEETELEQLEKMMKLEVIEAISVIMPVILNPVL